MTTALWSTLHSVAGTRQQNDEAMPVACFHYLLVCLQVTIIDSISNRSKRESILWRL
jgi:hypothetical protein